MKVLLFLFLISAAHSAPDVDQLPCAQKVKEQLSEWKATNEWIKHHIGGLKDQFFASPTNVFGEWILLRKVAAGVVVAKTGQHGRIEALIKTGGCTKEVKSYPHSIPEKNLKSDKDIKKFVETHKTGVIYVWSPQMGLSEKGKGQISKASKKLKLPLLILEDSEVDSLEFKMRNVDQHYPAVLVFKDSKIVSGVKHGYEKSDRYQSDITRMLGTGK